MECTCSSSAASLLTRMTMGSLILASSCALVGVDLPPLIVTSMTSRSGGACSFGMSDGLTVDGAGGQLCALSESATAAGDDQHTGRDKARSRSR